MRLVFSHIAIFTSALLSFSSCVSTGKYKALEQHAQQSDSLYTWSQRTLQACQDVNEKLNKQKQALQAQTNSMANQLNAATENNTMLRQQLATLSALSSSQAESIKKSLDNIGTKDMFMQDMHYAQARRDSFNLAILMNLKAGLGGLPEQDVSMRIDKGVVFLDLSDKLMFSADSSGYIFSEKAKGILARIARSLANQPDIDLMVVGNTDSIQYSRGVLEDNWDLSAKRATAIVRTLQNDFSMSPARMIAAAQAEFAPVTSNDTPEGRSANRRIRIIIRSHTDQIQNALDRNKSGNSINNDAPAAAASPAVPPAPVPAPPAPTTAPLPADTTAPSATNQPAPASAPITSPTTAPATTNPASAPAPATNPGPANKPVVPAQPDPAKPTTPVTQPAPSTGPANGPGTGPANDSQGQPY